MNDPVSGASSASERSGFAPLTNMSLALHAVAEAQDAGEGSPRLCLLYGYSGYGKSVAGAYVASRLDAAYVECRSIETQRSFLDMVAAELGITKTERTAPRLLQQIVDQLGTDPRPLIVDEMDHIVGKRFVDIIRDIHDATTVPILMIGEEALPAKLKQWERFDNRILVATAAQPATAADARKLRDHYCTRVDIHDDLVDAIADRCKGVTRRIVVNLRNAQTAALNAGSVKIGLEWWGNRPMLTGELPARRKAA
jgi:DNA transposition AAA+ family ATPase